MSEPDDAIGAELDRLSAELEAADDVPAVHVVASRFIGKKGVLAKLSAGMGALPPDERKGAGQRIHRFKTGAERAVAARIAALETDARARVLAKVDDPTLHLGPRRGGSLHPVTRVRIELERWFRDQGFAVLDGPHVEAERFNFDGLNFGPDHPARDMADTFFVRHGEASLCLRTHTSPVQVRALLRSPAPVRAVMPGTVFRRDDDATHSPMFHQIEGLYIDEAATLADLKATLAAMARALFGEGLVGRLRPSYFPFVEPGAEFDLQCPFCRRDDGTSPGCNLCKGSGFVELGGCGMVHPQVLSDAGHDPERVQGWAFGFGLDRIAMLRHGIPHLGLMFEGDVRTLEQFPC